MNKVYNYENVEWSFFHWDKNVDTPSNVRITIRNGLACNNFSFLLPKKAAKQLEESLKEEDLKELVKNISKNLLDKKGK